MKRLLVVLSLFLAFGCASSRVTVPVTPRPLSVSLFPYIPDAGKDDFKSLIAGLTRDFQAQHPDIRLTIAMSAADDPYDASQWPRLFGAAGPNAVEIDTLTLGDLLSAGYIGPIDWAEPVCARDNASTT